MSFPFFITLMKYESKNSQLNNSKRRWHMQWEQNKVLCLFRPFNLNNVYLHERITCGGFSNEKKS